MRHGLVLVALLLPLSGCVAPPGSVGYYPQPGYGSDYAYDGYNYNSGSPTLMVEGASVPLVFYGGGWGYYDGYRRWHRAPEGIGRHLESRHPGGSGYRPFAGGSFGRPEAPRPGPGGFPGGFHSGGGAPGGFHPGGTQPGAFHPSSAPAPQRAAAPQFNGPRGVPSSQPDRRHDRDDHR